MEDVKEYLLSKGFIEIEENTYEYIQKQIQQMIINGQPIQQEYESKLTVKYIGEGYIDDKIIHGYSIYQNGVHIVDEYVEDIEQFRKIL